MSLTGPVGGQASASSEPCARPHNRQLNSALKRTTERWPRISSRSSAVAAGGISLSNTSGQAAATSDCWRARRNPCRGGWMGDGPLRAAELGAETVQRRADVVASVSVGPHQRRKLALSERPRLGVQHVQKLSLTARQLNVQVGHAAEAAAGHDIQDGTHRRDTDPQTRAAARAMVARLNLQSVTHIERQIVSFTMGAGTGSPADDSSSAETGPGHLVGVPTGLRWPEDRSRFWTDSNVRRLRIH